jgi:hypothetical protein
MFVFKTSLHFTPYMECFKFILSVAETVVFINKFPSNNKIQVSLLRHIDVL